MKMKNWVSYRTASQRSQSKTIYKWDNKKTIWQDWNLPIEITPWSKVSRSAQMWRLLMLIIIKGERKAMMQVIKCLFSSLVAKIGNCSRIWVGFVVGNLMIYSHVVRKIGFRENQIIVFFCIEESLKNKSLI